jgi:hypothetical protein
MRDRFRSFVARYVLHSFEGMTFGEWWGLLRRHRFAIQPAQWPRALSQTALTLLTSLNARLEQRKYGTRVDDTRVLPPLFILGHWRSGTTHLHNLLTLDPQFAYPNIYQSLNPYTFLLTESTMGPVVDLLTMSRRPQDAMTIGSKAPAEDEFALCALTTLSPYLEWAFPGGSYDYGKYLTFREAPEEEVARWKAALVLFLKKLTLLYGRPVVLKSPPHTARIRRLLEAFPDARFVHIHRDPFVVFGSTRHSHNTAAPYFRLQAGADFCSDERIIGTYAEMYGAFFEERGLIPEGRFCEVGFEALERDPVGEVRSLYETLGLPDFESLRPRLEGYLGSIAGYRKNRHPELPEALRCRIAREWRRSFEEWGYEG